MTQTIFEHLRTSMTEHVRHRVWIMSDLQQSDLAVARECLTTATDDFRSLGMACDQIWYLGDSVQGDDQTVLRQMAQMHTILRTTPSEIMVKIS